MHFSQWGKLQVAKLGKGHSHRAFCEIWTHREVAKNILVLIDAWFHKVTAAEFAAKQSKTSKANEGESRTETVSTCQYWSDILSLGSGAIQYLHL